MSNNLLSIQQENSVNDECYGIAYNDNGQTFIMTFRDARKMEIINMTGTVVITIEKGSEGSKLFARPCGVAPSPDMSGLYIYDSINCSVTLVILNGDVKGVYKNNGLKTPIGVCIINPVWCMW